MKISIKDYNDMRKKVLAKPLKYKKYKEELIADLQFRFSCLNINRLDIENDTFEIDDDIYKNLVDAEIIANEYKAVEHGPL
jgi:hypothetical protein